MPRADSSITAHCQNCMLGEPLLMPAPCQGCHNTPIEGGTVPGRVPLCPATQVDTSVPIRAPWGLGACPAIRARGLLAGGGPALAGGTAPLEKEVDKGLGAVQSWGTASCPLSLWLLLLPLLLCGQREGGVEVERKGDATPNLVWVQGTLGDWRGYWETLTGKKSFCGVQWITRGHRAGLWDTWQAPGTELGLWGYRILRAGGQGAIWAIGCQGRDQDVCYRKPRSGGQVSMWVRDYRMLEWGTGCPHGAGPELWDSQGWAWSVRKGLQPGSSPMCGAVLQCLPATVRSLWERVMGCRGRLSASRSAVLGEWVKVRRGWVPGVSRVPWPRMAVSRSSSGGRTVRRVSGSPSAAGSVCMARSARSRTQPRRGPSSVEMATSTVRAGGTGEAVPSPFTAPGAGPEE